jgi:hypothetical protein
MSDRSLTEQEQYAMDLIAHACELLGWHVVLPDDGDGRGIYYMIIGTEEGTDTAMKRMNGEVQ